MFPIEFLLCKWRRCSMDVDSGTANGHLLLICGQYRMCLTSAVLAESTLASLRLRLHQLDTLRPLLHIARHTLHIYWSWTTWLRLCRFLLLLLLLLPLRLDVRETRDLWSACASVSWPPSFPKWSGINCPHSPRNHSDGPAEVSSAMVRV